eukprot:jgi/Botrbrau1/5456/Bobra.27_1s0007.1
MRNVASVVLYRALLRAARRWEKERGGFLDLRMPMLPDGWTRHYTAWTKSGAEYRRETAWKLLPNLQEPIPDSVYGMGRGLRMYLRTRFRDSINATPEETEVLLDLAFAALRVLGEQLEMARCSSTSMTRSIQIDVDSSFSGVLLPLASSAERYAYKYAYRIRISNLGEEKVQVTGRHWVSKDGSGKQHMIIPPHSPGVVGCLPILNPRDCFEYYSGMDLPTPSGSMFGCLHCTTLPPGGAHPERFDVKIAPFAVRAPENVSEKDLCES